MQGEIRQSFRDGGKPAITRRNGALGKHTAPPQTWRMLQLLWSRTLLTKQRDHKRIQGICPGKLYSWKRLQGKTTPDLLIIISLWPVHVRWIVGFSQCHFTQGDVCPHLLPQMHKHTGSRPMQTEGEQGREAYNTSAEIHSAMLNNSSAKQNTSWKRRMIALNLLKLILTKV